MNLYKASGEWSDELMADCATKGIAANEHPLVKALPEAKYKPYVPPPTEEPEAPTNVVTGT